MEEEEEEVEARVVGVVERAAKQGEVCQ